MIHSKQFVYLKITYHFWLEMGGLRHEHRPRFDVVRLHLRQRHRRRVDHQGYKERRSHGTDDTSVVHFLDVRFKFYYKSIKNVSKESQSEYRTLITNSIRILLVAGASNNAEKVMWDREPALKNIIGRVLLPFVVQSSRH